MTALRWSLAIVALLAAMVWASLTAEPDEWSRAEVWAGQRAAQLRQTKRECPVLFAPTLPDAASAQYARAAGLAAAIDSVHRARFRELLEGPPVALLEPDRAQLLSAQEAIAALQHAAHCDGPAMAVATEVEPMIELLSIVDAMLVQVREPDADAKTQWPLLLDAMAAGLDLTGSGAIMGQMLGAMCIERCADAAEDRLLQQVSPAVLAGLANAFELADQALAQAPCLLDLTAVGIVTFFQEHQVVEARDLGLVSRLQAWRQGFDVRAMGMARAGHLVARIEAFEQAASDEAWPERHRRLEQLCENDRIENSDRRWPWLAGVLEGEERHRVALTKLRLLRLAVTFHQQVAAPTLHDPLGGGWLVAEQSARTAVFRAGVGKPLRCATR